MGIGGRSLMLAAFECSLDEGMMLWKYMMDVLLFQHKLVLIYLMTSCF